MPYYLATRRHGHDAYVWIFHAHQERDVLRSLTRAAFDDEPPWHDFTLHDAGRMVQRLKRILHDEHAEL